MIFERIDDPTSKLTLSLHKLDRVADKAAVNSTSGTHGSVTGGGATTAP